MESKFRLLGLKIYIIKVNESIFSVQFTLYLEIIVYTILKYTYLATFSFKNMLIMKTFSKFRKK